MLLSYQSSYVFLSSYQLQDSPQFKVGLDSIKNFAHKLIHELPNNVQDLRNQEMLKFSNFINQKKLKFGWRHSLKPSLTSRYKTLELAVLIPSISHGFHTLFQIFHATTLFGSLDQSQFLCGKNTQFLCNLLKAIQIFTYFKF